MRRAEEPKYIRNINFLTEITAAVLSTFYKSSEGVARKPADLPKRVIW